MDVVYSPNQMCEIRPFDTWNDEALIELFDDTVSCNPSLSNGSNKSTKTTPDGYKRGPDGFYTRERPKVSRKKNKKRSAAAEADVKWNVGDGCCAPSQSDGIYYSAVIKEIDDDDALVKFVDPEMEERQLRLSPRRLKIKHPQEKKNQLESSVHSETEHQILNIEASGSTVSRDSDSFTNQSESEISFYDERNSTQTTNVGAMLHQQQLESDNVKVEASDQQQAKLTLPLDLDGCLDGIESLSLNDKEKLVTVLTDWFMSGYHIGYSRGYNNHAKAVKK